MKKNLFQLMAILMVAMLSVGFVSCSDDDDDDNGGGGGTSLIGTWSRDYRTGDGTNAIEAYSFSKSTGTYKNAYQTATFNYVVANGYIVVDHLRYSDSSSLMEDVWSYSINGKTLYLNGNSYTKQ